MKIARGKLQQIIQEELKSALSENIQLQDKFVVRVTSSSPYSPARTSYWPSNAEPFVGSQAEAQEQAIKATEGPVPGKRSRFARDWRVVGLDGVLDRMKTDDPMRAPLMAASARSRTNNADLNLDGNLDTDELEAISKELASNKI